MYFGYEYGMKIESEKGKGTTVEIVIPAILEASAENAANVQPQQEGARL